MFTEIESNYYDQERFIDWLILEACHLVRIILYQGFLNRVRSYLHFYIFVLRVIFGTQLCDIKYSYSMKLIFNKIYLIHRHDPKWYYYSGLKWNLE